jgi:putative hydrolase of the HAD superfamily
MSAEPAAPPSPLPYTGGEGEAVGVALGPGTLVCVDFDDTLVRNQEHFDRAVDRLCTAVASVGGAAPAEARAIFERVDARHHALGRHRNRFALSVLAAYAEATAGAVPPAALPRLLAIAALPYDAPPAPLPGVEAALQALRGRHAGPLWLVSTGDAIVQHGRIRRSGLGRFFDAAHVLPAKTPRAFAGLGAGSARRVMIGNSPATDILPALAAGYEALYVSRTAWGPDRAPLPSGVPTFPDFPAAVAALLGATPAPGLDRA